MGLNLPFTSPWLLAPMEGVTEPCFRDLVLERNAPHELGGAYTEFVRVHRQKLGKTTLVEHLGKRRFPQPVGLQLMGSEADILAHYTNEAIVAGAPLVDINFGCPTNNAIKGCAGSALLQYPERIEEFVKACVDSSAGRVPVTAKIRSGLNDDSRLEELAKAAEAGGAAMLTVHCRTREEGYRDCADWTRISRAVAAVKIPVCGNGSVRTHADCERMRRETGCARVMIGRAALGDPWIFSGRQVSPAEAATFLLQYFDVLCVQRFKLRTPPADAHAPRRAPRAAAFGAAGRVKKLLVHWTAGDLLGSGPESRGVARRKWLQENDPIKLRNWLADVAGEVRPPEPVNSIPEGSATLPA